MTLKTFSTLLIGTFFCSALTCPAQTSFTAAEKLAQTPPMGWNSWNCFRLNIDDAKIRAQAAALVKSGMKDAGYKYVVIDGGWEGIHDTNGVFHADPHRFPDMEGLCDFVHGLGLKIGIHTSPGPKTCSNREASYGHEQQDARTFAEWGMDFVKYDWCSGDEVYKPEEMQAAYKKMSDDLKATGRPMIYSLCQYGMQDVWKWGASVGGQMWRTTGDIGDNFNSVILHGLQQNGLENYAGPGHWNDPDMLEIGNGKMDQVENRTQMTLWCILAAPLFAGNDLTKMNHTTLEILTARELIAVNQDPAGIQGHRVWQEGPLEIWAKPLADGSTALGLFNFDNHLMNIKADFKTLGLPETVQARDLWAGKDLGKIDHAITITLPKHGSAMFKIKTGR